MKSLVPSASARMMDTAKAVSTWSWFDTMQSAACNTKRPQASIPYHKEIKIEIFPLLIENKRFGLSMKPPQFFINKKGEKEEKKFWTKCLKITAGGLEFRIVENTDAGNVLRRVPEIRRRCGAEAAERFESEALAFIKPREIKPDLKPLSRPFEIPASGICNRFQRGKIQTEIGLPMFEYKDQTSDPITGATLSEAIKATKIVRKSLNV